MAAYYIAWFLIVGNFANIHTEAECYYTEQRGPHSKPMTECKLIEEKSNGK